MNATAPATDTPTASERVTAWNRTYRIGVRVRYAPNSLEPSTKKHANTLGFAFLNEYDVAVVHVSTETEPVAIRRLEVLP